MRHHHDSPIELLQRLHQRFDRVHVQMVRRLVQQQNVRPLVRDRREHHARLLPSGQRPDRLHCQRSGNAERAQQGSQLLLLRERRQFLHVLQRGEHVLQRVHVVLREVADLEVVVAVDLARLRLQRGVQHAQEGGLADAVGSQQRDAAAHLHLEGHVLEDGPRRALVGERHVGELQDRSVVLRLRGGIIKGTLRGSQGAIENLIGGSWYSITLPALRFPCTQPPSFALMLPRRIP